MAAVSRVGTVVAVAAGVEAGAPRRPSAAAQGGVGDLDETALLTAQVEELGEWEGRDGAGREADRREGIGRRCGRRRRRRWQLRTARGRGQVARGWGIS